MLTLDMTYAFETEQTMLVNIEGVFRYIDIL